MRIGEILIARGWVQPTALTRVLAEQRVTKKRTCSLLVARGVLDPDHAARALAEQHHVAAVLQHHLAKRDPALAHLLPPGLARNLVALPLGRMGGGELIVCVRDPSPQVAAQLARTLGQTVVIATCVAAQLEELVDLVYDAVPEVPDDESIDVDMNTGPIALPDFGSMSLVELDDSRVAKDHTQSAASGQFGVQRTHGLSQPPPTRPTPTPTNQTMPPPLRSASGSGALPPRALALPEALLAIGEAAQRMPAAEAAVRFATGRWTSSLLVAIREGAAFGQLGHGAQLKADIVRTVVVPLTEPSIVWIAHATGALATEPPPASAVQRHLSGLLGDPKWPMAAPILANGRVAAVLVVGDTIAGDDSEPDLARLAASLGSAFDRCPS